jgi:hypothetical protein
MEEKTDFLEEVGKVAGYAQEYVDAQIELLKLEFVERLSKSIALIFVSFLLGSIAIITFTLLTVALGLYLGQLLDNYIQAFLIIAGCYFLLGVLLFILRKLLFIKPIMLSFFKQL